MSLFNSRRRDSERKTERGRKWSMGEETPEKEIEETLFIFLQFCMESIISSKGSGNKRNWLWKIKQKHKTKQKLSATPWKLKWKLLRRNKGDISLKILKETSATELLEHKRSHAGRVWIAKKTRSLIKHPLPQRGTEVNKCISSP